MAEAKETIGATFDIIGSNGVYDGASLKRRLELGASAVSMTTLFYESPPWATAVDKVLSEYAELPS